jgi:membrane protein
MKKVGSWIQNHPHYKRMERNAHKVYFTRDKIHLPRFITIFIRQLKKDSIQERAASMAFSFTLSIFPFIIFLFTLIPYIPIPDLNKNIMDFLRGIMPYSIYEATASTISDIINIPHGGLLSFGFIFALFTATNGVGAMISAFNKCYRTAEHRGFIKRMWVSMYLVFFISFTLLISIGLSIMSKIYLDYIESSMSIHDETIEFYGVVLLKYITLFAIFFITISLIYYIAPTVTVRWSFFSPGSFAASLLGILFTLGFSFYIENFNSYNKVYGSIGAFIGVMVWLYAISIVLLIGFEINASIDQIKHEMKRNARLSG